MSRYPFQAKQLSYGYISFVPYCDPDTLYLHHNRYYTKKVQELNRLVVQHRLEDTSLENLLTQKINLPIVQEKQLKSAAGAVYNHELYFDSIQNKIGSPPLNRLVGVLISIYGSMPRFKRLLLEAAESIPGSGWVWLVSERNGGPHIAITRDNEAVAFDSVQPILAIDMWEHAYFLDNQFDKEKYLDAWFSFIDWEKAEKRFLTSYY